MIFTLGTKSLARLDGVHPNLVAVVMRAIELTTQDFTVQEGLRTIETQREYLAKGVTKTLDSKHLRQPDGYGHAVDLVPVLNGVARWEWPLIYPVARAMQRAASELATPLVWGGVWDMRLGNLGDLTLEVRNYCARHPGPDFLDGPHYQIS